MDSMTLEAGTIKRIHVNQHNIRHNTKGEDQRPVFTVKCRGKTYIADAVEIHGDSRMVYRPEKPLSCGARVWMETLAAVELQLAE